MQRLGEDVYETAQLYDQLELAQGQRVLLGRLEVRLLVREELLECVRPTR
jgi:hypothetical protein